MRVKDVDDSSFTEGEQETVLIIACMCLNLKTGSLGFMNPVNHPLNYGIHCLSPFSHGAITLNYLICILMQSKLHFNIY